MYVFFVSNCNAPFVLSFQWMMWDVILQVLGHTLLTNLSLNSTPSI
jgi:hypothetical protein